MRIGLIDVGSNTARLLVADVDGDAVRPIAEERAYLGLGEELVDGALSPRKIEVVAEAVRRFCERASPLAGSRVETIVTAPGRLGSGSAALLEALRGATGWPVRVLSAEDEGRLAFEGAVARAGSLPEVVGVVDVGGGSSELAVGTPLAGPAWVHSLPAGSLRLTWAHLHDDPPTSRQLAEARDAVKALVNGMEPPRPDAALASGGSARALARIVGRRYGIEKLEDAIAVLASRPAAAIVRSYGIHPRRASTLVAGAIILNELAGLLDRPFEVARGGLREGAALELARRPSMAAA